MNNYVIILVNNRRNEVTCVTEEDLMNYYTSDFELEDLFHNYFWINSEKAEIWNKFVREHWSCLDDEYYYHYEGAEVEKELCDTWLCYGWNTHITTVKDYRKTLNEEITSLEKDMNFLDKLSF